VNIFFREYAVNITFHWFIQTRCLAHMVIGTHTCRAAKIQSSCDDCTTLASIDPLDSEMMWKRNENYWNDFVNGIDSSMSHKSIKKKKSFINVSWDTYSNSSIVLFFFDFTYFIRLKIDFISWANYLKRIAFMSDRHLASNQLSENRHNRLKLSFC